MKESQKIKQVFVTNKGWSALLLCCVNLWVMHYYLLLSGCLELEDGFTLYVDNLFGIVIDVCFLYVFFFLITIKRQKVALCITFFITLFWSFSNVLYSRFFQHYISLSAIGQSRSLFDWQMARCILESLEWLDLFYILSFCSFLLLIRNKCKEKRLLLKLFVLLMIMVGIDLFSYVLFCSLKPEYRYWGYICKRIENRQFSPFLHLCDPNHSTFRRGCARTILHEMIIDLKGPIQLTDDEHAMIKREMSDARNSIHNDSLKENNVNVIFILVESYMSFVSDLKVEGKEVTPFLNSLKRNTSVYYNGRMNENVTVGESSDGQFIYMTGLLPLRSSITVSLARKNTLPGLPKFLKRESRMVIPTVASMWLQDEMCRNYGFDNLYTSNNYDGINNGVLNDEQVFQLAMKVDKTTKQPFFSIILTMSMHQPFTRQIDPTFTISDKSIRPDLACYLNACHYTDKQIEKYFNHLKQMGFYKNSLIVITADHPVHNYDFGGVSKDIPLYLINAGIKPDNIWQGEFNQLDLFTTLLDILGCHCEWYGLGHSLLTSNYNNSLTSQKWDVSELILRSNYFDMGE